MNKQVITNSRRQCANFCLRKHYYKYECGIVPESNAKPLRMGTAYHVGLESINEPGTTALEAAAKCYEQGQKPHDISVYDWDIERITVLTLLICYKAYYEEDGYRITHAEQTAFTQIKTQNGGVSRNWVAGMKLDKIVEQNGRLYLMEHKLVSGDISPDSKHWDNKGFDSQHSTYIIGARSMGHDLHGIIHDVTRKPTISPNRIKLLDDDGLAIVLDKDGNRVKTAKGTWRQTGSSKDGYELQTRPEEPEEFGQRLSDDIAERPEYYFQRKPLLRNEDDLENCMFGLYQTAKNIGACQKSGIWPQNTMQCNMFGKCEYLQLCNDKCHLTRESRVPQGFVRNDDIHPELEGATYDATA